MLSIVYITSHVTSRLYLIPFEQTFQPTAFNLVALLFSASYVSFGTPRICVEHKLNACMSLKIFTETLKAQFANAAHFI